MIERRLFYGEDYDYFGEFLLDKNVKSYWVALFSLCLYWGFFWFFRHLFGANESRDEAAGHRLEANRRVVSPTVKSINVSLFYFIYTYTHIKFKRLV
jgi:hypothetical protein